LAAGLKPRLRRRREVLIYRLLAAGLRYPWLRYLI
jgi:hypothetical protein